MNSTIHSYLSNGEIISALGISYRVTVLIGRLLERFDTHLRNVENILDKLSDVARRTTVWR